MDWLNYHHLRYFWVVAREGSISRASKLLHVSQPSISTQLRQLERTLGEKLLQKHGRGLQMTDMGRFVFGYAEQIFTLGRDMLDAVKDRPTGQLVRLQVGVADVVPKYVTHRLLAPLLREDPPIRVVVHEDRPDRLLGELAVFGLDVVVADAPVAQGTRIRAYHHPLGSCPVAVFGKRKVAASLRRSFPESLRDQPFVLPVESAELRRDFDAFLREREIRIQVVAEIEDAALQKTFGADGIGLLVAPTVLAEELEARHDLVSCGEVQNLQARYYAITVERRVRHPAFPLLMRAAREMLVTQA